MKTKLLFFITLFALSFTSFLAQPTLTSANCNPFAGDIFTVTTTSSISPGNAGANQTWNLSAMSISGMKTITMSAAVSTPSYSTYYANSNVSSLDGTVTEFYKTNSNSLQGYGNYYYASSIVGTIVTSYTNPVDYLHLPCNFNDSFTDTYSGSQYHTGGTPPTMVSFGSVTVTADGYGTLILPTGTVTNVMRVHTSGIGRDSIPNSSFGSPYTYDYYEWYVPGTHNAIASVSSGGGSYISNYPTGLNENNLESISFELFPVPASEKLTVSLQTSDNELTIFNNLGQKIVIPEQRLGSDKIEINTSQLPNGIYVLKLENNGATGSKRFIISR
jgi:hypothetical protein